MGRQSNTPRFYSARDADGNIVGTYDDNPILNTIVYDVEFPDGAVKQYAANVIAENMYTQS